MSTIEELQAEVDRLRAEVAMLRSQLRMERDGRTVDRMNVEAGLYGAAREACHACGLPWTDPRTGITYPPPNA